MNPQVKVMTRRRLAMRWLCLALAGACLGVVSLSAPSPVVANCGLAPPINFLSGYDPRSALVAPIRTAFFGEVIKVADGHLYGRGAIRYVLRVNEPVAGARRSSPVPVSAWYECGEVELERGVTYLFALTDDPIDFDNSLALEKKNGRWVSVAWGEDEPLYLHDPGDPIDQTPAERAADRVPTKLPALIRFLQRKLGPLPDTATEPVAAAVETLPLNPLLLVLAGTGGAFVGRRVRRRKRGIKSSIPTS